MIGASEKYQDLRSLMGRATEIRCELEELEEIILFHVKNNKAEFYKMCDALEKQRPRDRCRLVSVYSDSK